MLSLLATQSDISIQEGRWVEEELLYLTIGHASHLYFSLFLVGEEEKEKIPLPPPTGEYTAD